MQSVLVVAIEHAHLDPTDGNGHEGAQKLVWNVTAKAINSRAVAGSNPSLLKKDKGELKLEKSVLLKCNIYIHKRQVSSRIL